MESLTVLLRHVAHAHVQAAATALLAHLTHATNADQRHAVVYEALQDAAAFGYDLCEELRVKTDRRKEI